MRFLGFLCYLAVIAQAKQILIGEERVDGGFWLTCETEQLDDDACERIFKQHMK